MDTVIIKYNAGNIQSVLFALGRIGAGAKVSDDPNEISSAERIIFPGVGEASSAMKYLRQRELVEVICGLKQPVLGICLGMQLLCMQSEENAADCLGVFPLNVKRFDAGNTNRKVPQIGWNTIYQLSTSLFEGIKEESYVYHVHGYYVEDSEYTIAKCEYGNEFATAIRKDNFYGVQFHAEKSGQVGEKILKNFMNIK